MKRSPIIKIIAIVIVVFLSMETILYLNQDINTHDFVPVGINNLTSEKNTVKKTDNNGVKLTKTVKKSL